MQAQYRDGSDFMELMRGMYARGELAPEQAFLWATERPAEEFYDSDADPDEVNNLADDPAHADALQWHRDILSGGSRGQATRANTPNRKSACVAP